MRGHIDKIISDSTSQHNRIIYAPFCSQDYNKRVFNFVKFREALDARIEQFSELFPAEIGTGYQIKNNRESKKLSIPIHCIKVSGFSYTIRPSFVMPYMTGRMVKDVEKAMFLVEILCIGIELKHLWAETASFEQQ